MAAFSTLRKTCLSLALLATAGLGFAASAGEAAAGWHGGYYQPGFRHGWHGGYYQPGFRHGWHGGWHHGGPRYGWGHRWPGPPVYGAPRCRVTVRWVEGPYGWHRVSRRVCPAYAY